VRVSRRDRRREDPRRISFDGPAPLHAREGEAVRLRPAVSGGLPLSRGLPPRHICGFSEEPMNPPANLAKAQGVQRVPTRELELFIVRHFLDPATCAAIIERIDAKRRPSTISDD